MLKTYRIIPLVFILFLFGFTLITVSPVIAEEPWNPSMGMCHNSRPCIKQNVCGDQCAVHIRESKGWMNPSEYQASRDAMAAQSPEQVSTSPSGGEVAELNARIVESQSQVATLTTTNAQLQEQLRAASAAAEPLNAKIAELNAENARLLAMQTAPADPSGDEGDKLEEEVARALSNVDEFNSWLLVAEQVGSRVINKMGKDMCSTVFVRRVSAKCAIRYEEVSAGLYRRSE